MMSYSGMTKSGVENGSLKYDKSFNIIKKQFAEVGAYLKETEEALQKEQLLLEACRDRALQEIDACFDQLTQIINRRRQLLKSEVNGHYEGIIDKMESDNETLTLSLMCLGTLKKHTEEIMHESSEGTVDDIVERALQEIAVQKEIVEQITVEKSFIDFSRANDLVNEMKRKMRSLGRVRVNHYLPSKIVVNKIDATVSQPSSLDISVIDFNGNPIDKHILELQLVSFEIMSRSCESATLSQVHMREGQKVTLNFMPKCCGLHLLTMHMFDTTINKVAIQVEKAKPSVIIRGDFAFDSLNAVTCDTEGNVYAVDSWDGKLVKYSSDGEYQWEYNFCAREKFKCFDAVFVPNHNAVICTVTSVDQVPDIMKMSINEKTNPGYDISRIKAIVRIAEKLTADLLMKKICYKGMEIICIEKQGYVTLGKDLDIIISDSNNSVVTVYEKSGRFKHMISCGEFDRPGYLCARRNGTVLVSDIEHNVIRVSGPDGRLTLQMGTTGTDPEQLSLPVGLDIDEEGTVIVADNGNNRLQVFDVLGQCKAVIDVYAEKGKGFSPWDVSVAPDGHFWVIDRSSQTVQKFRYK